MNSASLTAESSSSCIILSKLDQADNTSALVLSLAVYESVAVLVMMVELLVLVDEELFLSTINRVVLVLSLVISGLVVVLLLMVELLVLVEEKQLLW